MANTLQRTPRELAAETGKKIVVAIITYFVFAEVFTLVVNLVYQQAIPITGIIRFAITIVSCVFLYKGHNWAKLLLAFGATMGIFTGLYAVYSVINNPSFFVFATALFMTIFSGLTAYFLIFSSEVSEFFDSRKV
jgi:uncharacterized membrane protein (DUF373 family)